MVGSSNWAWGMYPGLSHGAVRTLEHHGSEEQKYLLTKPCLRCLDRYDVFN